MSLWRIAIATSVGAAAGAVMMFLGQAGVLAGPVFGCFYGAAFAVLAGGRPKNLGMGLLYGISSAVLAWIAVTALLGIVSSGSSGGFFPIAARRFPSLISFVLFLGAGLGLSVATVNSVARGAQAQPQSLGRPLLVGGFAGLLGGWVFGKWMASIHYFPLIAGIVGSDSIRVGMLLHFAIAFTIGSTFGLLFSRCVKSYGPSVACGAAYGLLWWFLGPLTILPWLSGKPLDWSHAHASTLFGSLVGHLMYGMVAGFFYASVDRLWVLLFIDSDPINRRRESVGGQALQAFQWGSLASVLGGLLFSIVMIATDALPRVAHLVGGTSPVLGFLVHMCISAIVGITYGVLFRRVASNYGEALGWGLVYGLLWWFIGPLTLFPILLGGTFAWDLVTAQAALPSMIGHMIYGAAMATVFYAIEQRYDLKPLRASQRGSQAAASTNEGGTLAPVTWCIILGFGTLLPVLLGK